MAQLIQKAQNTYLTAPTKAVLKQVAAADGRTQEGEVGFLVNERAKQLGIHTPIGDAFKTIKRNRKASQ